MSSTVVLAWSSQGSAWLQCMCCICVEQRAGQKGLLQLQGGCIPMTCIGEYADEANCKEGLLSSSHRPLMLACGWAWSIKLSWKASSGPLHDYEKIVSI